MLSQFYSGKKSEGFRAVYPLIQKYYQLVVRIFEDSADRLGNMGGTTGAVCRELYGESWIRI